MHSLPGANHTIYLDFTGHTTEGTTWNSAYGITTIVSPPYDIDGDTSTFNATEIERIQITWQTVSEDFRPFNIDVTTEDPGPAALSYQGGGDTQWGTRVVITDDTWANCSCGGHAYIGSFDDRIKASAPTCYITGFRRLLESIGSQDAEQNFYYIKRFKLEPNERLSSFIGDHPESKLISLTEVEYPRFEINFGGKNKARDPEIIEVADFIGVKSYKAKGKRLTKYQVELVQEIEPVEGLGSGDGPEQPEPEDSGVVEETEAGAGKKPVARKKEAKITKGRSGGKSTKSPKAIEDVNGKSKDDVPKKSPEVEPDSGIDDDDQDSNGQMTLEW